MDTALLDWALELLAKFGYLGLFLLMFADTAMLLHFVPSLVIIGAAVLLLATTPASLVLVILVMTLGSVLGSLALYALFYWGGRGFLEKYGKWFGVKRQRVARLERLFQRPLGEGLVLVLRLVPLLRVLVSIPAGLARMDWRKYLAFTTIGSLLFNTGLAVASYEARTPTVQGEISRARNDLIQQARDFAEYAAPRWWLLTIGALVIIAALAWAWTKRARLIREYDTLLPKAWERATVATGALGLVVLLLALAAPSATYSVVGWIAVDFSGWASSHGITPTVSLIIIAAQLLILAILGIALKRPIREGTRLARAYRSRTRRE